jgi:hypothetical protein
MTTNQGFRCGHENPASNTFCAVCGAARLRQCRLCEAPIHWNAAYCSACGNRLDDDAASVEAGAASPSPPQRQFASDQAVPERDSSREQEVVDWAAARRARYEGTPDPATDDPLDEERAEEDRRRRPLAMVAAVAATLAVVVAVGYFAVAKHTVFLEPMQDKRDVRAVTPAPQPEPSSNAGQAAVGSTSPPASTTTRSTTEDRPASPSEPAPARNSRTQETKSADAVGLPARETATAQSEESPEPSRIAASSARTSEERMAAFLVEELGQARASEKARSNADWYDEGRSERRYWQRVAEAVSRRGGR